MMDFDIENEQPVPACNKDECNCVDDSTRDDMHYHIVDDKCGSVDFDLKNIDKDAVRQLVFNSVGDAGKFYHRMPS